MMQESQARSSIKTAHALNLLDDFATIGVRSVSLVSDGESTLSPAYVPFIQHAAKLGIDVGYHGRHSDRDIGSILDHPDVAVELVEIPQVVAVETDAVGARHQGANIVCAGGIGLPGRRVLPP